MKLREKLKEWLKESARINDEVSYNWRSQDIYNEQWWAPNGWEKCGFTAEEARFIEENDDFFKEVVKCID